MFSRIFARWSIPIGVAAAVLGIVLYSQLDAIENFRVSLAVLNSAAILSISLTLLGLLTALAGGLIWAYRAPLASAAFSGISVGAVAYLLAHLVKINVHGPSAAFLFVILAGALGSLLILAIAAFRFAVSLGQKEQ
jgi:hypothetical protein